MRKLHSTYLLFILIFSSTSGFARNHLSSVYKMANYDDKGNNINPLSPTIELKDGATYYAVAMTNEQYASLSFAATLNVTFGNENSQEVTFKYYPNPAKDYLNIRSSETIDAIEVYSLLGQLVKNQDFHSGKVRLVLRDQSDKTYAIFTLFEGKNQQ